MFVGDLFDKKAKMNSRKAHVPPKELVAKKARVTSAEEAASAHLVSSLVASPKVLGSQL